MRNFLRTLALISIIFTALFFNVCNASDYVYDCSHSFFQSLPCKSVVVEHSNQETSMATMNNTYLESSVSDKNDSYNLSNASDVPVFNTNNDKIALLEVYQNIFTKSHNISSYLKNEICARAP